MQAVLLAAGESSRFWPLSESKHKSLISLMGKPLIVWTLENLQQSGIKDIIIVQSPSRVVETALEKYTLNLNVQYVIQESAHGMGDALLACKALLTHSFFLLHAHQFLADKLVGPMSALKEQESSSIVLCGQHTDRPEQYGILSLEGTRATGIVEKPERERAPSNIRALGIYLLSSKFVEELDKTEQEHYAFESTLDAHMKTQAVNAHIHEGDTVSLKYPWDLFSAARILMDKQLTERIAEDAEISPLAHVGENVFIDQGARVYEFAVIKGPCYIGANCVVGTHALVRDYTNLEPGAVIGAYGEAARSIFQANATTHSGFFGDSIFDRDARIGAGTVTANVKVHRDEIRAKVRNERIATGRRSLGVVVGEGTQLGIHVSTMPGVLVGARSFVGPNAVVENNVGSDTRLLVKQEQAIKEKRSRA